MLQALHLLEQYQRVLSVWVGDRMGVHLYTNGAWTDSGKIYRNSVNLFDNILEEGYYDDQGVLIEETSISHSTTYIPVNGTTYTISGLWYQAGAMANFAVYEWDNDKNWLRRSNRQYPPSSNKITFTVGADTAYITLQIQTIHSNIMLNIGSIALPYEPYNVVDWYTNNGHSYSSGAWS